MRAVLDGLPETPATGPRYADRACPECRGTFRPVDGKQLFCSTAHRRAWNNRAVTRGAVLAPYAIAARQTRNGTRGDRETGKRASNDANTLIQRYRDEDREAGRMDQVEYLAARYRAGFDPI